MEFHAVTYWRESICIFLALVLIGCGSSTDPSPVASRAEAATNDRTIPIASYMGDIQRYSYKMGQGIRTQNSDLVSFYADKMAEVSDQLKQQNQMIGGVPVAAPLSQILDPTLDRFQKALKNDDWKTVKTEYDKVIQACNGCHKALNRGFIEITPPGKDAPPYNQNYRP